MTNYSSSGLPRVQVKPKESGIKQANSARWSESCLRREVEKRLDSLEATHCAGLALAAEEIARAVIVYPVVFRRHGPGRSLLTESMHAEPRIYGKHSDCWVRVRFPGLKSECFPPLRNCAANSRSGRTPSNYVFDLVTLTSLPYCRSKNRGNWSAWVIRAGTGDYGGL